MSLRDKAKGQRPGIRRVRLADALWFAPFLSPMRNKERNYTLGLLLNTPLPMLVMPKSPILPGPRYFHQTSLHGILVQIPIHPYHVQYPRDDPGKEPFPHAWPESLCILFQSLANTLKIHCMIFESETPSPGWMIKWMWLSIRQKFLIWKLNFFFARAMTERKSSLVAVDLRIISPRLILAETW